MPLPLPKSAHPADPLPANVGGKHRTEPSPPEPHRLMTDVDAALEQQVLNIAQRQRKSNVHQDHQPDYLG
jgi:hypothetical protein